MDLTKKFKDIKFEVRDSLWPGYDHSRGYAGMVLPFSSGHLLAFRVFYKSSIAPYISVWHCTPQDEWSIYNDGPSLETTCPRWWSPALRFAGMTKIDLDWHNASKLSICMDNPALEWSMSFSETNSMKIINKVSAFLPLRLKRTTLMRHIQEWMAKRIFDMGDLKFSFFTPTGKDARIVLEEMYLINDSKAVWKGEDLGDLVSLEKSPEIAGIKLPKKPVFVDAHAFEFPKYVPQRST